IGPKERTLHADAGDGPGGGSRDDGEAAGVAVERAAQYRQPVHGRGGRDVEAVARVVVEIDRREREVGYRAAVDREAVAGVERAGDRVERHVAHAGADIDA